MNLSIQQKYILEVLRKVGCLKRSQLQIFLNGRFPLPDQAAQVRQMDAMLRQMRNFVSAIRVEGDIVRLDNVQPDHFWLEAIDVMLELAGGVPPNYKARLPPPLLLRFILDDDAANVFAVAKWQDRAAAAPVLAKQGDQRVIWLADSAQSISLPPEHFLAVRQQDGTHRFYGSQEP